MGAKKLTPKQSLFVKHYLANGMNGTQAAISARYSRKTAKAMAAENLTKPAIMSAINKTRSKIDKILDDDGSQTIKDIRAIANDKKAGSMVRLRALELIGRTQRIFVERREDTTAKVSENIEEIYKTICDLVKLKEERGGL